MRETTTILSIIVNQEILNRILDASEFKNTGVYRKLLTFLVDARINELRVKETILEVEVFDKHSNFNPSDDSSVRVYVSNLRKKIDRYYNGEGKKEKVKIKIPKGNYELFF